VLHLSDTYMALFQIDHELVHWPNFVTHKCKQRVTKITQYLIKMRRLRLRQQYVSLLRVVRVLANKPTRPKLIGVKKKLDRREAVRERKALSAAHLERSIERELIERLKSKAYGDAPLNVNESVWQSILDQEKKGKERLQGEFEAMIDDETDEEDADEEFEEEGWGEREFVSDLSGDEDEGSRWSDLEDVEEGEESEGARESDDDTDRSKNKAALGKRKKHETSPPRKRPPKKANRKSLSIISSTYMQNNATPDGPRVEVEYEQEYESVPISKAVLSGW
jgi:protein MAK16